MAGFFLIGGLVIAVAAAIFSAVEIAKLVGRRKAEIEKRAEIGTDAERATVKEVGLGVVAGAESQVESLEKGDKKKELGYEASESLIARKLRGDKAAVKAVKAVEEGAEAAEHEEAAEEAAAAIEGRSIGIEAAAKKITNAIMAYSSKKKSNVLTEEYQASVLDDISKKMSDMSNVHSVDAKANSYLREFLGNLVSAFNQDLEIEKRKDELLKDLVAELENALSVMKTSLQGAKIELKRLGKEEKKSRKYFKKELADYEKSLKARTKEIEDMGANKDVDQVNTVNLMRNNELQWKQLKNAKALNEQLRATYDFMKKVAMQMKKLLNYALSNEKEIKKYDSVLSGRKKQINKRLDSLRKALESIERTAEKFKIANPHEVSLSLSSSMKQYFRVYKDVLEEDLEFDDAVRQITVKNSVISTQMQAFQQLAATLTQSEEAVEFGVGALTRFVGDVAGGKSQIDIAGIIVTLKKTKRILDYEKGIESFMKKIAQSIENKSKQLNQEMQSIMDEDKKLIAQIKAEYESSSSHLGSVIGSLFQKKISIDDKYKKESSEFAKKLKESNPVSARTYTQTIQKNSVGAA